MFIERTYPFRGIIICASKPFGERNDSNHSLSNNLPFCESIEANITLGLAFIADFFAVVRVATKASNVAMSGDYEEAKRIIEIL